MKKRPRLRRICWILATTAMVLAGCGGMSPAVKYYTLSPLTGLPQTPPAGIEGDDVSIGIGPVEIPRFLDRPQIVTRSSANRIEVSEAHRWGSSLDADFLRVLADNVSSLLGTNRVAVYPWRERFNPTYRIALDVKQFEGRLGKSVELDVTWTVTVPGASGTSLVRKSRIRESTASKGYEALIAAKSNALATLSREIAQAIEELQPHP